jgi:hypothetical protein
MFAHAQAAHDTKVKFDSDTVSAVEAGYEYDEETLAKSFEHHFEKLGFSKNSRDNGFKIYKNVSWPDVSEEKLDVYIKVDGGRKRSTVVILLSRDHMHFLSADTEPNTIQRLTNYLNNFKVQVASYQLEVAIAAQEAVVLRATEMLKDAHKDSNDARAEKEKLEKKIDDLNDKEDRKQKQLNEEKKKLATLKNQLINK